VEVIVQSYAEHVSADLPGTDAATDVLMQASRLMTAVVARTLAGAPHTVTVPQLRVLVMLHTHGGLNLGTIAAGLAVNPSNASRTCDKLVEAGLVARTTDPEDRRRGVFELSEQGRGMVASLMQQRRAMLDEMVSRMPGRARHQLTRGLTALIEAADHGPDPELFSEARSSNLRWLR
jgi:DNA-binding MarR family transcriptional regulator